MSHGVPVRTVSGSWRIPGSSWIASERNGGSD